MIATLGDWLPVAAMAVLETAVALSMFVPAFGVAALIMAARRRQLAREPNPSEQSAAQGFIAPHLDTGSARCIIAAARAVHAGPPAMTESR